MSIVYATSAHGDVPSVTRGRQLRILRNDGLYFERAPKRAASELGTDGVRPAKADARSANQ